MARKTKSRVKIKKKKSTLIKFIWVIFIYGFIIYYSYATAIRSLSNYYEPFQFDRGIIAVQHDSVSVTQVTDRTADVCSVTQSGNLLAISANNKTCLYNVEDPSNMALIGEIEISAGAMAIDGNLLYIFEVVSDEMGAELDGFKIYNISDTLNPELLLHCGPQNYEGDIPVQMEVQQGIVYYLSETSFSMWNFNTSLVPDIPGNTGDHIFESQLLGTIEPRSLFSNLYSFKIEKNFVYLMSDVGISILNISNPTNMHYLGEYELISPKGGMDVSGDVLVAGDSYEMHIVNVSDPTKPELIEYGKLNSANQNVISTTGTLVVEIYDETAVCITDGGSVWLLNLTDNTIHDTWINLVEEKNTNARITFPQQFRNFIPSIINYVSITDGAWYYATMEYTDQSIESLDVNLHYLNISQVFSAADVSEYDYDGYSLSNAQSVYIDNNIAYVADGEDGLRILDISDKNNIKLIGTFDTPGNVTDVEVSLGRAYLTDENQGLKIIDITDPTSPVQVGIYDTVGNASAVELQGMTAFIADGDAGLSIVNITNASAPAYLGSVDTPGFAADVEICNNIVYIADKSGGIRIINATILTEPLEINSKSLLYDPSRLTLDGQKLYAVGEDLTVCDISNPTTLETIGTFSSSGYIHDISIDHNVAFASVENSGIDVLDITVDNPTQLDSFEFEGSLNASFYERGYLYIANGSHGFDLIKVRSNPADDIDNDCLNYFEEVNGFDSNIYDTDTDDDGMPDGYEANFCNPSTLVYSPTSENTLSPIRADGNYDPDKDGLTNLQEYQAETYFLFYDTDGDGAGDGDEVQATMDPLDINEKPYVMDWALIAFIGVLVVLVLFTILRNTGIGVKKAPLNAFLSHAVIDFETYRIKEMAEFLGGTKSVNKGLYCEQDMKGNIDDWMDQMVPLSQLFIFIATKKSVFNSVDCAREIELAQKNGLFMIPIRTPEVTWKDIANISLPTNGFDYSEDNPDELYKHLSEYIKKIKTATDNLAKEFKKNDMVDLRLMDEPFELNPGDCVKIARILIKNARATGAVSADKRYFVGNDEIITRAKIYQETQAISNIFEFLDTIGLDREYMSEVQEIIGITKKKTKKKT